MGKLQERKFVKTIPKFQLSRLQSLHKPQNTVKIATEQDAIHIPKREKHPVLHGARYVVVLARKDISKFVAGALKDNLSPMWSKTRRLKLCQLALRRTYPWGPWQG